LSEDDEVIVELFPVDVHGVIRKKSEVLNSLFELFRNLFESFSESFTLCATKFNSFEFIELHDCGGQVKNIVASFRVSIKSGEKCVECQFPLSFGLVLVLKVVLLELGADIDGSFEFSADVGNVFGTCTQSAGNDFTVDVFFGSGDNLVAGHLDQDHKARRSVVELGKLVDFQKCVHDWWENFRKCHKISTVFSQSVEEVLQCREELCVVVGLDSGLGYFSLEFGEGIGVG
jgi:hypothetical protein